ncbi:hypothetical protein K0M31_001976 [Melipona bicolor]|uniref:Uncharacterized protein n=1 Tax=Melipona bicolor TaxID=60889 RepID=A0AA40GGU0_9HYME|nr:hypothetical protein K0M31_001976 [Melipona bicolor]
MYDYMKFMLEIAGINLPEGPRSANPVDAQFLETAEGELFFRLIHLLLFYLGSNELCIRSCSNGGWEFFD